MRFLRQPVRIILLCVVAAGAAGTSLWLYWPASSLSRAEVVQAAIRPDGGSPLLSSDISGIKLIHRFDLPTVIGQDGATDAKPWDRVWVVSINRMLIPPSGSAGQPVTYTVEVIRDQVPAKIELYYEDGPGNRPPGWDSLLDLSHS